MTPLTETEAKILHELARENARLWIPEWLARATGLSRHQLVPVVNRMEDAGLVTVKRYPRQTSYEITETGRAARRAYRGPE